MNFWMWRRIENRRVGLKSGFRRNSCNNMGISRTIARDEKGDEVRWRTAEVLHLFGFLLQANVVLYSIIRLYTSPCPPTLSFPLR